MFLIASSLSLLANCSTPQVKPETIVQTRTIERDIPIQQRPRGVELSNVEWNVVNQDNLAQYTDSIEISETDEFVFMSISVRDYEKLALNLDELRRYITQQQEIITYYENSIRGE
jgi:hypothetical protein